MQTEGKKRSFGVAAALAVSMAAMMIAVAPVAMLVIYAKPVMDNLAESHVALAVAAADQLPTKFAAPYLLPAHFQEDRGTCWDFATIGILEQSYRANGVAKGYLKPDTYVRLSEQAFGISMIEACQGHPDVCDVLGDFVYSNNTDGGEVWWLYSLTSLYNKVLPTSVCPYDPTGVDGGDKKCDGMAEALATNPIKFDIKSMQTAYNVEETKKLMVATGKPLAWSSTMHNVFYYMPCTDAYFSTQEGCSERMRVRCPTDKYYNSEWCARFESAMYDMDGEFFMHGNTVAEGGHAMNVVGYNDEFVTKQGQKGGFLIKNSWHDLAYGTVPSGRGARGSHSVAYWMQQISAWDEKALCPGPLNPDNWISCVTQQAGPTMGRAARDLRIRAATATTGPIVNDPFPIDGTCLSGKFMDYLLNVTLQPTEFKCLDSNWCSDAARYRYFLASLERNVEQDLAKVCMLRYDSVDGGQFMICTPYVNPSVIAYIFAPLDAQQERLKNDPDFCGYYFWPYEVFYKQTGLFVNSYTTYFDIVWDDMSYLANSAKYPDRDYTLIKTSTKQQKQVTFGSLPSPFPKKRY